jgi:hypothetical protein
MQPANNMSTRCLSASNAAFAGYANAAVAAYAEFAMQALGAWAQAFEAMTPKAEPTSWYRHPDGVAPPSLAFWTFTGQPNFNPFTFWMRALPLEGNPAAWPMALAMMGYGLPRSVAYPLAGANTAALEAVTSAGRAIDEHWRDFSAYRSDGGHATAQVRIVGADSGREPSVGSNWALFAPWLFILDTRYRD